MFLEFLQSFYLKNVYILCSTKFKFFENFVIFEKKYSTYPFFYSILDILNFFQTIIIKCPVFTFFRKKYIIKSQLINCVKLLNNYKFSKNPSDKKKSIDRHWTTENSRSKGQFAEKSYFGYPEFIRSRNFDETGTELTENRYQEFR